MNRKKVIGIERGLERWSQMFAKRAPLGDDRVRVAIDVQPSWRVGDIDMSNDLNRAWNVRTLTLMSRARLLRLDAEPPPAFGVDAPSPGVIRTDAEAEERYEHAIEEQRRHRMVTILHHGTISADVWESDVAPVRNEIRMADERNHGLMREVLKGSRCISDILMEAYTIPPRGGSQPRPGVTVARACGGCQKCRDSGTAPFAEPLPTSFPQWHVFSHVEEALRDLQGAGSGFAVFYEELSPRSLSRFLQWLVGQGVRIAVVPEVDLSQVSDRLYNVDADGKWVFAYPLDGFRFIQAPALPSVVYVPPEHPLPRHLQRSIDNDKADVALRVLLAPADTEDATRPGRLLRYSVACRTYTFDEISTRIGL